MLRSNEKQFRGGLVCKARRLVVSLKSRQRVIKKKQKVHLDRVAAAREKDVLALVVRRMLLAVAVDYYPWLPV